MWRKRRTFCFPEEEDMAMDHTVHKLYFRALRKGTDKFDLLLKDLEFEVWARYRKTIKKKMWSKI